MCERYNKFLAVLGIVSLIAVVTAIGRTAGASAPAEANVQGLYEGTGSDAAGEFKVEARLVAQGNGNYNVFLRQIRGADKIARVELLAKTAGDNVVLAGKAGDVEWKGSYAAGTIKGECGPGGTFHIQRIQRKSPTLGKKPPPGAIVLLDGKDFSQLTLLGGAPWDLDKLHIGEDGSIQVPKGGMNSRRNFPGNFDLHVEFMIPLMPAAHSQGRGNSGVFLPTATRSRCSTRSVKPLTSAAAAAGCTPTKTPTRWRSSRA